MLTNWAKQELISNSWDNQQRVSLQAQARGSVRLPSPCGLASCNVTDNLSLQSRWPGRTLDVDTVTMPVANQGRHCAIRRWLLLSCNLHWTRAKESPHTGQSPYRGYYVLDEFSYHAPKIARGAEDWVFNKSDRPCSPELHFPDPIFHAAYISLSGQLQYPLVPRGDSKRPSNICKFS